MAVVIFNAVACFEITIEINNYSNSGIFFNSIRMMQPQLENNPFTKFAKKNNKYHPPKW